MLKSFLQRLVGLQTMKVCLINPTLYAESNPPTFNKIFSRVPVVTIVTKLVPDIKFIDTQIPMQMIGEYKQDEA